MITNKRIKLYLAILNLFIFIGCVTPTNQGDVKLYKYNGYGTIFNSRIPCYVIRFPKIRIGSKKEFIIKVRNLPRPIFVDGVDLKVPTNEINRYGKDYVNNQPWKFVKIQFLFKDMDGNVFFRKNVDFSKDWAGGAVMGRPFAYSRIGVEIFPRDMWSAYDYKNYDLVIKVINPSKRSTDVITINAVCPIGANS